MSPCLGEQRRLRRLSNPSTTRMLIASIDDSLISGPADGLADLGSTIQAIIDGKPQAILGFCGQFERYSTALSRCPHIGWIANLTASTTRSFHTRKRLLHTVEHALAIGCDAVAAHVNVTSKYEGEMLEILGRITDDAQRFGMPVLAIVYPRTELADGGDDNYETLRYSDSHGYTDLVKHCVRVGIETGASIVKTQYTGSRTSFESVIAVAEDIPVVTAGGPLVEEEEALATARSAIQAGAAGVAFGRNIFNRRPLQPFMSRLNAILHEPAE